jgi:uncharacterized repeat protein (TIGR01451 family)
MDSIGRSRLEGHRRLVTGISEVPRWMCVLPAAVVLVVAASLAFGVPTAAGDPPFVDGSDSDCQPWVDLDVWVTTVEIAEEGWVWANGEGTSDKFREVAGVVEQSKAARNDTPANHYSHDWNADIKVDDEYLGLLSDINDPNEFEGDLSSDELVPAEGLELEWETGITPGETSGDGANPMLPRWALPNVGDRVWTNGHWIFDCGHFTKVDGVRHFPTEIHPGRAIATMRPQALPVPGSGTTPVPVTATDLYIHGRGGYSVQQLECGIDIIIGIGPGSCPTATTQIDDIYEFEVCLPPKPADTPWAKLGIGVTPGPDDDGFGADPDITKVTAESGCLVDSDEFGNDFDDGTMLQVEVDLRGSGISPTDVYSRKIVAGWVTAPATPLPHLSLNLKQLDLHEDYEADPFDAEMSFWWMSVDRGPTDEWHRLVNYDIPTHYDSWACTEHVNKLEDMDDDHLCGNGFLDFAGPEWTFYLRHNTGFSIFTRGYEQDCYDDHFGTGLFSVATYVDCHFGNFFLEFTNDWGNNDDIKALEANVGGPGVDPLTLVGEDKEYGNGDFEFVFDLAAVPLADEDDADVGVEKTCTWDGEVALVGKPITCTIEVSNAGPGLPRNVVVTDEVTTGLAAADYTVGAARFHVGDDTTTYPCSTSTSAGFSCEIGSVPVDGTVTIEVVLQTTKPGLITNGASVSTDSTDATTTNDEDEVAVDVYRPVIVDIQPGATPNAVNVTKGGVVSVAILSTATFAATSLNIATQCFGDAETPSQRSCAESHGTVHVQDVNKDKRQDLLFHFDAKATGIDLGDTTACLRGTTTNGTGFFGCDTVKPL